MTVRAEGTATPATGARATAADARTTTAPPSKPRLTTAALADPGRTTEPPADPRLTTVQRAAGYRIVAELFLYPDERDMAPVAAWRDALAGAPEARLLDAFLAHERAFDPEEYLDVLELAPPCPLYLGAYLFEEPASCRGAGMSGRNAYMLELKATYRHFGLEPDAGEMADFLPLLAEFLAMTTEDAANDAAGVRLRLLERMVAPALPEMRERLERYESPYAEVIDFLAFLVADDTLAAPPPDPASAGYAAELPVIQPPMLAPEASGRDGRVEAVRR